MVVNRFPGPGNVRARGCIRMLSCCYAFWVQELKRSLLIAIADLQEKKPAQPAEAECA